MKDGGEEGAVEFRRFVCRYTYDQLMVLAFANCVQLGVSHNSSLREGTRSLSAKFDLMMRTKGRVALNVAQSPEW